MKKLLFLLTLLLLPMAASADDVEIDHIYYELHSDIRQAYVISHPDKYSGDIVIPGSVEHGGSSYKVTQINSVAFSDCSGLTSVFIPSSVTGIGDDCFQNCSSLASIVVEAGNPNFDSRDNCNAIINKNNNKLIVGCKNTVIPGSVTEIGEGAFTGSGITSVTIPGSVGSIGGDAFFKCTSLTSVTIPSSVTYIGGNPFDGCSSLASIVVEEGNPQFDSRDNCNAIIDKTYNLLLAGCKNTIIPSSVTIIGESAFWGMTMTSIVIPASVTAICDMAFCNCSALTDVYCYAADVPSTSYRAFLGSSYQTATLHVPAASVEKYKKANIWKDFGNIVGFYQCAKPTIAFANGKLTFGCETEGAELVATISPTGSTTYQGSSLLIADLTTTYRVSVYAKKDDWLNSETATLDIDYLPNLDDVNGDGQITIADAAGIVNIILGGK